jgi:hypothetical protein
MVRLFHFWARIDPESVNPGGPKVISWRTKHSVTTCVCLSMRALPARADKVDIMRKTALLTGVAGLFLMTAPAFAQDSTAPQTPPAPAEQPAQEAPQSLTLNPGQTIVSSDGQDIGQLVGARNGEAGQELTVRAADGSVRAVPTTGISQQGEKVAVGWTAAEFQASPPIADETGVPAAEDAAPPAPVDPSATPTEPMPAEPATPPSEPMAEPTPEPAAEPQA